MENFLSGGIKELEEAKAAIEDETEKRHIAEETDKKLRATEKAQEALKRNVESKIENTVRERRNALLRSHDSKIAGAEKELKSAEREKRDAKNSAVESRVKRETAGLLEENKKLAKENRALLKKAGLPAFCNTFYYHAIYAPKHASDFLALIITILVCLGVIPFVVMTLVGGTVQPEAAGTESALNGIQQAADAAQPAEGNAVKIIAAVAAGLFFALVYFIVFAVTKGRRHSAAIEKTRPALDRIRENRKTIKRISRNIRSDKDESGYGLESFNEDVDRTQGQKAKLEKEKQDALMLFDTETAVKLKGQIINDNMPETERLAGEVERLKKDRQNAQTAWRQASNLLTGTYSPYLGKKYTSIEMIEALEELINSGQAATISQAMECFENPKTKENIC